VTTPTPGCFVYLVRHGRTHLNAEGVVRGHLDVPLDDAGRDQAQRLAHMLIGLEVAAVISSPLTARPPDRRRDRGRHRSAH
jgi:broad specificity phosphatase PhoE